MPFADIVMEVREASAGAATGRSSCSRSWPSAIWPAVCPPRERAPTTHVEPGTFPASPRRMNRATLIRGPIWWRCAEPAYFQPRTRWLVPERVPVWHGFRATR